MILIKFLIFEIKNFSLNIVILIIQYFKKNKYENLFLKNPKTINLLKLKKFKDKNKILVNLLSRNTEYQRLNLIISKILNHITGNDILILVNKFDLKSKIFAESFGFKNFVYFKEDNIFKKYQIYKIAKSKFKKNNNINKLLKLSENNISIGKIIYDHIIRHFNLGSIDGKINEKYFIYYYNAYLADHLSKKIFKENKIDYFIQSEKHWIPANIIFQNALLKKIKIFCRLGVSQSLSIRLYDSFKGNFLNKAKISNSFFRKFVINKKLKKEINLISIKFLKKRFNSNLNIFISAKKKRFCRSLNLDPKKKLVCIFSNNLTDGIFSNEWSLYKDNFTWLIQTIKTIKKINDVNWIIKGHPIDIKRNNILTTKEVVSELIRGEKNIKFLDHNNKLNNILHNSIDLAVSAHGSVAIEYPSIGVPCIIAGDAFCSGKGFTIEPKTTTQYENLLNNINKIKKLNEYCIFKARVFYYIYNYKMRTKFDFMKKSFKHKNNRLFNSEFYRSFKNQVFKNYRHLEKL